MHAIKDRVYQKLSRYFSDSETSLEEVDPPSKGRSDDTDGKSSTSLLSYVLNFDWFRQSEAPKEMKKSGGSNSFRWGSKRFSWKEKPMERHQQECDIKSEIPNDGVLDSSSIDPSEKGAPGTSRCSNVREDANSYENFNCSLKNESVFVNEDLYQFFEASLPNIVKGCQWILLYSTARHGISLQTLFRKSSGLSGPCLLITGDKKGAVFGGLIDCPLKPTPKRKYQGTYQSFVFSTLFGEPRIFRATGANRYFCLCLKDLLALGGGGNFALCLNEDLLSGTSGPCETFGSLCLAHDQEFEVKDVELWGFAHLSQCGN